MRQGSRWRKVVSVCGAIGLAMGVGCGGSTDSDAEPPGALLRLTPELLTPGESFSAPLVAPGGATVVKVVKGALPDGLELDEAGTLVGTPTTSAQLARFTVRSENAFGEPHEYMDHVVAVGVRQTTLTPPSDAVRTGDVLHFEHDWGMTLTRAWAWDSQLGLAWPMRVGAGFSGTTFAPMKDALSVIVAGEGSEGIFATNDAPADKSVQVVAQLTWRGDANIDLCVLPQLDSTAAFEINAAQPLLEQDGLWLVRHEIAEDRAPGPEVLTFSKHLPSGRWVLVATKAGGAEVDVPMWLSLRRRDGLILAERRYDALLSDVSAGTVESDLAAKTQSFKPLGVLVVGPDREVSFESSADSDLFGTMDSAKSP